VDKSRAAESSKAKAEGENTMTKHKAGTRDQPSQRYGSASEWLAIRLELLKAEKELRQ